MTKYLAVEEAYRKAEKKVATLREVMQRREKRAKVQPLAPPAAEAEAKGGDDV